MCPENTAAGMLVSRLGRHQSSKVSDLPSSRRHKHNNKKRRSCPTYLSLKLSTFFLFSIYFSKPFYKAILFWEARFHCVVVKKTFFLRRKSFEIETNSPNILFSHCNFLSSAPVWQNQYVTECHHFAPSIISGTVTLLL